MEKKTIKKETKSIIKKGDTKKTNDMKGMTKLLNIYFLGYMAYSLAFLGAGIVLLTNPAMATRTAELVTAFVLIIIGLGNAFNYSLSKRIKIFDFSIIYSIVSLILGALIISNPFGLINFLSVTFGVFLIISGLVKYNFALNFKFIGEDSWKLILTIGILNVLFGIFTLINPFANLYYTQVIGLFMVLYGVMEMTHTILFKQRSKYFLKLLK